MDRSYKPYTVSLLNSKGGTIQTGSRTVRQLLHTPSAKLVPVLNIENSTPNGDESSKSSSVSISCYTFSLPRPMSQEQQSTTTSQQMILAICDQKGHIWAMNFESNKFWTVARPGVSASAIAFTRHGARSLVVGLSNRSIHCYALDSGSLVAKLPAYHQSPVTKISTHPFRPLLLTLCSSDTILWDTDLWTRKRVLAGFDAKNICEALFSPLGEYIVICLNDGNFHLWDSATFDLKWKATSANIPSPVKEITTRNGVCFSNDGSLLVAVQNADIPTLSVWNVKSQTLIHEISVPSLKSFHGISQCKFIASEGYIVALTSSIPSSVLFVDVLEPKIIARLESGRSHASVCISDNGEALVTQFADAPAALAVWSLDQILNADIVMDDDIKSQVSVSPRKSGSPTRRETTKKSVKIAQPDPKSLSLSIKLDTSPIRKPIEIPHRILRTELAPPVPPNVYSLVTSQPSLKLSQNSLNKFLKHFGEFPENHRVLIWRFMLQLPENRESFNSYLHREKHESLATFRQKFPIKSERTARSIERVISCLMYWSPIFENLEFLPSFVFPFVKVFGNDTFSCFETILTLVMNWCQQWWEFYPNAPVQVLDFCEDLLGMFDPKLLAHLTHCGVTSQIYIWSQMQSLYSDCLSRKEWLTLFDHVFCNDSHFLTFFGVAMTRHFRTQLLDCTKLEDFKYFFSRVNPLNINRVLTTASRMRHEVTESFLPASIGPFTALLKGAYPIFNKYPESVVNYQRKLRNKIRGEEIDYVRRRHMRDEVTQLTQELRLEQAQWGHLQGKKDEQLDKWWSTILEEEHEFRRRKMDRYMHDNRDRIAAMRHLSNVKRDVQHDFQKVDSNDQLQKFQSNDQKEAEDPQDQIDEMWEKRRQEIQRMRELSSSRADNRLASILKNRSPGAAI